jgi:hypothetical protein
VRCSIKLCWKGPMWKLSLNLMWADIPWINRRSNQWWSISRKRSYQQT